MIFKGLIYIYNQQLNHLYVHRFPNIMTSYDINHHPLQLFKFRSQMKVPRMNV